MRLSHPRLARSITALCAALAWPGCTTQDLPPSSAFDDLVVAGPVIIPLGGALEGDAGLLDAYYHSIVAQMQQAMAERDPDWLDALLAQHDRDIAPDWSRESMRSFRSVGRALRVERWFASAARIELRGATPPMDDLIECTLRCEGQAPDAVRLPGRGEAVAPARFLVQVRFEDRDCMGGRNVAEFEDILTLADGVDLGDATAFTLPFDLAPMPAQGCERKVRVRLDLLPGARLLEGEPVPGHRLPLADRTFELHPRGIEPIQKDPLATLRAALVTRDPRHFDHVWLASRMMPRTERQAANALLIGAVRLGPPDLGAVAGACLREATGLDFPPTDRDRWLAWWVAQRREGR